MTHLPPPPSFENHPPITSRPLSLPFWITPPQFSSTLYTHTHNIYNFSSTGNPAGKNLYLYTYGNKQKIANLIVYHEKRTNHTYIIIISILRFFQIKVWKFSYIAGCIYIELVYWLWPCWRHSDASSVSSWKINLPRKKKGTFRIVRLFYLLQFFFFTLDSKICL